MKRLTALLLLAFGSYLVLTCGSSRSAPEKFTPLFDGGSLRGWVNVNCAPETWTVGDGMIVCTGLPMGILRTEKMYENYVLELEWRHTKAGGNAGLFIHSDDLPAVGSPFSRSIEVQIMDGNAGDVFAIKGASLIPENRHPRGWMRALPSRDRMNPTGEWNRYRVVSKDGMVELHVNGDLVTRAFNCNPRKGYICLESEGSEVHFRNIRIAELPSSPLPPEVVAQEDRGYSSLYNGLDFRGWKWVAGHEGHWTVEDNVINYDGQSEAEREEKNLWSEGEFEDFAMIVDWRLAGEPSLKDWFIILPDGSVALEENGDSLTASVMNAGDSGIYLRGSSKSQVNIWNLPVGSGEVYGYRTDLSMPPEVRRAVTPVMNADNPVGEWNRFEITVAGSVLNVELNGKHVIRAAELPGMPARGPVALQHHGDHLQFCNVYVRELR
ncbi:MAG: DUF1080 domain-containing protein [Candidatus Glassbacteria bacterium]|nr:DUF1080 domain-containing protein [Candidatus Glassbacteria bacterium]